MMPVALSDVIAVGEVPTLEQIAILAAAGFRSLLNTQPEGEVARHMSSADCFAACETSGLVYRHIPVESRRPPEPEIQAFTQALAELPKPIYACCYSGSRTAAVWALAATSSRAPDEIIAAGLAAGYDIAFMRDELVARHAEQARGGAPVARPPGDTAAPAAAVLPVLVPSIIVPRAASAGGFAVAG